MQQRKYFLTLAFLGFIQTATAQITDSADIFSSGDLGTTLVNFIDVITIVEIDTIAQTALFSTVVAIFYFASLNIFEQVFLRLEEIIKEAMSGDTRGIHGSDEYPTGVKGMAFAVAFISANGITGLIGLLAAIAMGLIALLIILIVHGKLLGILSSIGLGDTRSYPDPTPTPEPDPEPKPEPEPSPDPEPTTPSGPEDGPTTEPESPEAELVFEYLDDMRKFRSYVNNRYDRQLSMDPFSTSSGFSGSAHSGKLNLDHKPLDVAEFIAKLTRQTQQFKNAIKNSNVSEERRREVISEINKTIRLYNEVERGKLEND